MVTEGAQENTFPEKLVLCPVCDTRPREIALSRRPVCVPSAVATVARVACRRAAPDATRKSAHRNVASNNLRRLQRINRVSLRVEDDRTPERLQLAAEEAARSGDLRTSIE